ncbi:MAG: hypothetical protein ABR986_04955 [Methanomassiliicoccales archaeon]|jgi:hypothetical protein
MDRKAGYKECPRCGLRNKPSALQCDFCGLRFIAGEDWDDNIQALEKMGGNEEKVLVDEDISKRIEATIVKRDKINAPAKAKEPEKDDFDYFKKDPEPIREVPAPVVAPSIAMAKGTVIEAAPEPRLAVTAPEPVQASPAPERIIIQERPPVVAAPEPVKEKKVVRRVVRSTPRKAFKPQNGSMRRTAFTAVLVLGLIWYLVAIMFGDDVLGRAGNWALVTISTVMLVAGAVELFIPRTETHVAFTEKAPEDKPHQEVLICPKCHELVKVTDKACPDCGVEFRGE